MKQIQDAYIVSATRLPIGKSGRGYYKNTRPDEMLVRALQAAVAQAPGLDPAAIQDAIIGCAFPEGEQGMNVARSAVVLAGLPLLLFQSRRSEDERSPASPPADVALAASPAPILVQPGERR